MSRQAHLPDGTVLEFPDDTPDAVMDRVVKTHLAPVKEAPKDNNAFTGFLAGAVKPIDNLAKWSMSIPGVRKADSALAQIFGMPTADEAVARNAMVRQNNSRTGYQMLGNIAGTLPTLELPGGAFAQGAASGALLSDKDNPWGVATDATIGGIAGKASEGVLNALSYAAKPVVSKANRMLYDAGIPQTLGQIAQGGKSWTAKALSTAEQALTSAPLVGDMIQTARMRGVEAFNKAVANRALANIGEAAPREIGPGIELVDFVSDRLSKRYQELVPKLSAVYDKQFQADLAAAKNMTAVLPDAQQGQFAAMVKDVFANRSKGPQITGQELKDAESRLTTLIKKYGKSTDADQNILSDALWSVRQALRNSVSRSNPGHAAELQALNKGWAQLGTFESAANAAGNATGVVTPAQMLSASRSSGFRDDLTRAAKEVLPSTLPDSGTARRAFMELLLGGAAGSHFVGPVAMAPAGISAAYTKPGQDLLNAFVFGTRPKALQQSAKALNAFAKVAPAVAPALVAQRTGK